MAQTVAAIVNAGIPVQGHIGLTPQTATSLGGFKVQGKSAKAARQLVEDARALEEAGCFSIVLEAIPCAAGRAHHPAKFPSPPSASRAGPGCDGQVLVIHDLVGLYDRFTPQIRQAVRRDQRTHRRRPGPVTRPRWKAAFSPTEAHSFTMKSEELDQLLRMY